MDLASDAFHAQLAARVAKLQFIQRQVAEKRVGELRDSEDENEIEEQLDHADTAAVLPAAFAKERAHSGLGFCHAPMLRHVCCPYPGNIQK